MFRAGRVIGTAGNSVRVGDEMISIPSSMFYTLDDEPVGRNDRLLSATHLDVTGPSARPTRKRKSVPLIAPGVPRTVRLGPAY